MTQAIFAASGLFALCLFEKDKNIAVITSFFIGLSYWWFYAAVHLWNGNMYVHWLLLGLVFLWYRKSMFLTYLFFGISVALHPASLVLAPIFLYELNVLRKLTFLKKIGILISGMLLPWLPIIGFEIMTKGFLIREWLNHKSTGMSFEFNFHNLSSIVSQSHLGAFFILLIVISLLFGTHKMRRWFLFSLPMLLFYLFISPLHSYYLYPALLLSFFLIAQSLTVRYFGRILLVFFILLSGISSYRVFIRDIQLPPQNRLEDIQNTVSYLEQEQLLAKDSSYALVSIIDLQNSTPQADDYRFVFRTKGYEADAISSYPSSDRLLIIFENDKLNPLEWSDWHVEHFGSKELVKLTEYNGTQIVIYKRN